MPEGLNYRSSGVNLELGDDASQVLYEAAKLTWENRRGRLGEVVELFEDFSGLRAVHVGGLPQGTYMNMGFDGVGTKMELGERIDKHDTVAYDLFAMVSDDAVRYGAEPVLVGSLLDVRALGQKKDGKEISYIDFVKQLAVGYINAAREANVAVVNGEVAELGARVQGYGPFNYNWGAGLVWFARKERMLTGHRIKPSDTLVGLREHGFRSNGFSLVRKVMVVAHGNEWHKETYQGTSLAELALHPSKIYTGAVVDMFGGFAGDTQAELHGVAHITGGGIPGKLGRLLRPTNLGADIHDPFAPCELMLYCQERGNIADDEAYRTWNMGQGMIIATPEADKVINVANKHDIEAKVIGRVSETPGIRISNRGLNSDKVKGLVFT